LYAFAAKRAVEIYCADDETGKQNAPLDALCVFVEMLWIVTSNWQ